MNHKLLVTLNERENDVSVVKNSGCEVLAEYPDTMLVRCSPQEHAALVSAGLEVTEFEQPIPVIASSIHAPALERAESRAAPLEMDPNRTNYFVVKLVGPSQSRWLESLRLEGCTIQGKLAGSRLLVGMLPRLVEKHLQQPWVESITPYYPELKFSPKLRRDISENRDVAGLEVAPTTARAQPDAGPDQEDVEQIEISTFEGEGSAPIAAMIRKQGGTVISESSHHVVAAVRRSDLASIAREVSVRSISPHRIPKLHNDVAAAIMSVPNNGIFGNTTLRGSGQVVAVADSGLDTGDAANLHADFAGRIVDITSLPNRYSHLSKDSPPFDDGPADRNSGHGSHVAGSVLGNGTAAREVAAGQPANANVPIPQGSAPEAQLYMQAVEQQASWKSAMELWSEGKIPPLGWPWREVGLYGLPEDLTNLLRPAYDAGARIHTNSWGADLAGQYNDSSAAVDRFMWEHRDMLVLFSAGNEGVDSNDDGLIDVDSINTPGTAKNCLTVGATENLRPSGSEPEPGNDANWNELGYYDRWGRFVHRWPRLGAAGHVSDDADGMAAFSSRGPTDDGRIKPDVVAPGTNVLSVRSSAAGPDPLWGDLDDTDPLNGLYCWSGGTSMSTPLVAGAAAMVREHLVRDRNHFVDGVQPSGALIKAFLINAATPIAGQFTGEVASGPNPVSGFGRVDVAATVDPGPLGPMQFSDDPGLAVSSGQIRRFRVTARVADQPIKITLVWTDAPSPSGQGGHLQNTLYLQARPANGDWIDGDVTPFPQPVNNVQQIVLENPGPGEHDIRVRGKDVLQPSPHAPADGGDARQDFALVVSNVIALASV